MTEDSQDLDQGPERGEVGRRLKEAREAAGLALQTVADQLHLRPAIVRAIEEGDYQAVPSELFLKGYIRSYARHLGLPDDEIIRQLTRELEPEHLAEERAMAASAARQGGKDGGRGGKRIFNLLVLGAVVLALILVPFLWPESPEDDAVIDEQEEMEWAPDNDENGDEQTGPVERETAPDEPALGAVEPVEPVATPAPAPAREPAPAPDIAPDEVDLVITFSGDCWVEVVNGEGTRVVARLATAGDRVEYTGPGPLDILLGAVDAVERVEFMGETVDLRNYPVRANRTRFELAAGD